MVTIIRHPHFITLLSSPSCPQPPIPSYHHPCTHPYVITLLFSPFCPHPPVLTLLSSFLALLSSLSYPHSPILTFLPSPPYPRLRPLVLLSLLLFTQPFCHHPYVLTVRTFPFCPYPPVLTPLSSL